MTKPGLIFGFLLAGLLVSAHAQVPPLPATDQLAMLKSPDPQLAHNKRTVFDFWDHIYYMTWFDVFRIDTHGLIAEHWDPSEMWVNGRPPGAEFFHEWEDSSPTAGHPPG